MAGNQNRINRPAKQNDELLKGIFEEWFVEFLQFLYPDADDLFDFDRGLTFMDKELLAIIPERERSTGRRIADLLVKVFLKDGSEKWILVHTEIEGGNQKDFAFRMYKYNYRLLDRYEQPVETIAVFTGGKNQRRPSVYSSKVINTSIQFRYLAYHIYDHSEADLLAMDNPFALVVLACQKALHEGKVPEQELAEERSTIARALIASGRYDKDRIIGFLVFLKNFIYIQDSEINRIFDTLIYQVTGGTINMSVIDIVKKQAIEQGIEQGIELGVEKSKYEFVESLIVKMGLADEQIVDIANVSEDFVRKVRADLSKDKK